MASQYGWFGQFGELAAGAITPGVNLITLINPSDDMYVSDIAIHAPEGSEIEINGSSFYIDERCTLEFHDLEVKIVKFPIGTNIDRYTTLIFGTSKREDI